MAALEATRFGHHIMVAKLENRRRMILANQDAGDCPVPPPESPEQLPGDERGDPLVAGWDWRQKVYHGMALAAGRMRLIAHRPTARVLPSFALERC
jgi:hypothetical protein